MLQKFTLEYWVDDNWYVGRLRGIPGVFSQGKSLEELEDNVRDAYQMMVAEDEPPLAQHVHTKEIGVEV